MDVLAKVVAIVGWLLGFWGLVIFIRSFWLRNWEKCDLEEMLRSACFSLLLGIALVTVGFVLK